MLRGLLLLGLVGCLLLGLALCWAPGAALAQAGTATLTLIAGQTEVAPPGGTFGLGVDGQTLAVGARVRTGPEGRAVLTFFDGSTATLDPGTELTLSRVQPASSQGGLFLGIGLAAGRVWTQVTSLVERGSSFEVQAGGATAVAREGVTGFRMAPDGSVTCWLIDGAPMTLRTLTGEIDLLPGYQVTVAPGQMRAEIGPRTLATGLLEIQTEGSILARVVTPERLTVGFPFPDLVVNQLIDATTSLPEVPTRWLRIRGPSRGEHHIILQSIDGGPYRVRVRLSQDGRELLAREWTASARAGELSSLVLTVDGRDGVATAGRLSDPAPLVGEPPGRFIYP